MVCHLALKKAPSVLIPLVSTLPSALSAAVFFPPCKQRKDNTLNFPYLWMARGNTHLLARTGGPLCGSTTRGVVLQWF